MAAPGQRCLDAGQLADEVVQLAALGAELATRMEYEPAADQIKLILRVIDAALSVIDEAGCFARFVLQRAESDLLPGEARRRGRAL